MRDTWSLVAQTSVSRFYWLIASLLTTVVTARFLGPEGRGVYVAAIGWVTLFAAFGNLSLSQVIIFLAAGRPHQEWLPSVLGSTLSLVGVVSVLGTSVAALLYLGTDGRAFRNLDGSILALAFVGLPILLWLENGNSILMALSRLTVMNAAQMIGATAALALTLTAVGALHLGVHGAVLAMALGQGVTVAIALVAILRLGDRMRVESTVVRELLSGGAKLHLNAIGTFLFTQANVLILNHYRKPDETAYFQLAVQLLVGMQIVPAAISAVTYSLVSRKGADEAWPEHRKLLLSAVGLMVLLAIAAYFVAPVGVRIVFGAAFEPAVPLFRILLLGTIGMTMSHVMGSQWIARGLFLQAALLTLLVGCLTVLGNYLFVPSHGAVGAAWVTVGTYAVGIAGNVIMFAWVQGRYRAHQRTSAETHA